MKTVLVTGSSRGLGKSAIIKFAENGYNVVINYNNSEKVAYELQKYIEDNFKVGVLTVKADVGNENDVKEMFKRVREEK